MRNRIASLPASTPTIQELRPELTLSNHSSDRPFRVDMERFFDFSFGFAEALIDLEDRFTEPKDSIFDFDGAGDLEIDVRWM